MEYPPARSAAHSPPLGSPSGTGLLPSFHAPSAAASSASSRASSPGLPPLSPALGAGTGTGTGTGSARSPFASTFSLRASTSSTDLPLPLSREQSTSSLSNLAGAAASHSNLPGAAPATLSSPRHSFSGTASGDQGAKPGGVPRMLRSQTEATYLFGAIDDVPGAGILHMPGRSYQAAEATRDVLQDNHINHHIFINDRLFHNHFAHHVLAAYSLGGSAQLIRDIAELQTLTMAKPMLSMQPVEITPANWTEHLGKPQMYPNYLHFFHRLIAASPPPNYAHHKSSAVPVVERYLFDGAASSGAHMLARAVAGALHPWIHIGYGLEFGLDAIVAEGLAQCAVHKPANTLALFPRDWPPRPQAQGGFFQATLSSALSSLSVRRSASSRSTSPSAASGPSMPIASPCDDFARAAAALPRSRRSRTPRDGMSAFTIVDRMLYDPLLAPGRACKLQEDNMLGATVRSSGERIREWADEWRFGTERARDVDEYADAEARQDWASRAQRWMTRPPDWQEVVDRAEELVWLAVVLYAACARRPDASAGRETKLDFFLMHCVTSSLFLPTLLERVSPHLRPFILHSHLRIMLAYWVSRGRPRPFIAECLMKAEAHPTPPGSRELRGAISREAASERQTATAAAATSQAHPTAANGKADSAEMPADGSTPTKTSPDQGPIGSTEVINPWHDVLTHALDHTDEHVTKTIRTLAWASNMFGHSPPGMWVSSLPGTEVMDGSIFLKAAGMTLDTIGWVRAGDEQQDWDRPGLGWDETWFTLSRAGGLARDNTIKGASSAAGHGGGKGKERASDPIAPVPRRAPPAPRRVFSEEMFEPADEPRWRDDKVVYEEREEDRRRREQELEDLDIMA